MISNSEKQTKKIAQELIEKYKNYLEEKCLILALEGDLGTGKTVFAKGAAEALGIKKVIRSPSFIIMREFPYALRTSKGKFYHLDLWRMESEKEILSLRIRDLIKPENILVIEWAEKMAKLWPKILNRQKNLLVKIEIKSVGRSKREIEIRNWGRG